jgi:hypothetical protein
MGREDEPLPRISISVYIGVNPEPRVPANRPVEVRHTQPHGSDIVPAVVIAYPQPDQGMAARKA